MRVGYFIADRVNPFQHRYFNAVATAGAEVVAIPFKSRFLQKIVWELDLLHLDWLHTFYKSRRGTLFCLLKTFYARHQFRRLREHVRIVNTVHNLASHDSFLSLNRETRFNQALIEQIDAFAVFNSEVEAAFRTRYELSPSQEFFVTPHGNYVSDYEMRTDAVVCRQELGLPQQVPLFLFFGSLRKNKGVDDLLQVFPDVHQQTGAHLMIAGSKPSPAVSEHLLNIPDYIHLHLGDVPEARVSTYFGAADSVVLPFREMLNSGSAILAASLGKHCLLPNTPTITANLDLRSFDVFSEGDRQDLKRLLVMLGRLPSGQLREKGMIGRAHVVKHLDWAITGESAIAMYQRVLSLKSGG